MLVRHAETEDNIEMRLSGWTDSLLSPRGERQTMAVAEHILRDHPVTTIYSSPLIRARRTADAIAQRIRRPILLREDLREMYFGEFEGWPLERIERLHPEFLATEFALDREFMWPSGESRSGFAGRVRTALDTIAARHAGESVAVVTHGGVISYFLAMVAGRSVTAWRDYQVPNASLTEVLWNPNLGSGTIVRHGADEHLLPLEDAAHPPEGVARPDSGITDHPATV